MISKIFVNLPVKDLSTSMDFFKTIGFSFNPQFTDKTAACMVMSDDIYAMLLTHDKVKELRKSRLPMRTRRLKCSRRWQLRARPK